MTVIPSVWCTPLANRLTVRQITLFAMLGAMTFAAKYAMSGLPNIEPVSLMVMVFACVFGKKSAYPIGVYVMMEFLFYGLGFWNFIYLYIWAILAAAAYPLRGMENRLGWALLSGTFGLLFGALCAPVDLVVGGPALALSRWVSGIPFDIAHCIGNFVIALVLFPPVRSLTEKLSKQIL